MSKKPIVVLIAEDDKNDILAIKRAWRKHNITNQLHIVREGEECLDYLNRRGKYSEPSTAPWPGVLLLDIKMPRMDGFSVLKHIRENKRLRFLPVTIFSNSNREEDRLRSYELGANAYVVKPEGFMEFSEAVKNINLFWELVELPVG